MTFWQKYKPLFFWIAITLAAAGLGAWLAGDYAVYKTLEKPPLAPPAWLFPVVWSILYVLIGVAAGLVARSDAARRRPALVRYVAQLLVNVLWPVVFFRFELYSVALVWLAVLIGAVLLTRQAFRSISATAGWLMLPYLLWCAFALYLNAGIVILN